MFLDTFHASSSCLALTCFLIKVRDWCGAEVHCASFQIFIEVPLHEDIDGYLKYFHLET